MYAQLTDPRKETLYSRYVPTQKTLTPQGLLSQSNLEKRQPRNPYPNLPLETGLNASYAPNADLSKYGYQTDTALSTSQNKVFYNPSQNKVLYTVAGTDKTNLRDLATDAYLTFLGQAGLKKTNRYKEAQVGLEKVRQKYKGSKKVLVGHSLGSSILNTMNTKPDEQLKTFATGSGLYSMGGKGEGYRTYYDILSATSKDKVIPSYKPKKSGNLRGQQDVQYYGAHSYQNLKSIPPVFV